jgi:hypothetical protein
MTSVSKTKQGNPATIYKRAIRKVVRRVCDCNYNWAKSYYFRELEAYKASYKAPPLLVYQMGKVGSSSITRSLKKVSINRPIYHLHFMSKDRIVETEDDRRAFFRTDKYSLLKRPWLNEFLLKSFNENKGQKWKVISLTREAVARNISAFFENLDVIPLEDQGGYEISSHYYKIPPTIINHDNQEVLEELFIKKVNHFSPEQFFDREIKGVLGIDVFTKKFSHSTGFSIYYGEYADLLLLRLEDLDRVAKEAFDKFLGIADLDLKNANVGAKKKYAPLYKEFKKNINLPDTYLNMVYDSLYMQHFYSAEEIDAFKQQWNINRN